MRYLSKIFFILISATLVSCMLVGNDYVRPEPSAGEMKKWNGQFHTSLEDAVLSSKVLARWWNAFENKTLTSLIEQAAKANLDIRTAKVQLRRARAERNITEAARSPQATIGGSAQRNSGSTGSSNLYRASLDASWELDLFGGLARGSEASEADLEAAKETQRDVLIMALAETALNYNDLVSLKRRRIIVNQNLKAQEKYLKIISAQQKAGSVIQLDVDRARSNVESVRSQLPVFDQKISQVENRIAVLLGKNPGSLYKELSSIVQLTLPSEKIAIGVPANVLRRRPDVRKAERQLAAATARVGVAKSDLYPKLTLNGSIGLESLSPSGLLTSIVPRVQYTLFDGGRIREQIKVQSAMQEEALIQYERTILKALEDVQNSIVAFAKEQERSRSLQTVVQSAMNAINLAESQYRVGETNFTAVLDSQRSGLDAEDQLIQNEAQIVENLIRLYKSLGGGWDPMSEVEGKG